MSVALALFFLFVGGFFGVLAMALAAAARDRDAFEEGYYAGARAVGRREEA